MYTGLPRLPLLHKGKIHDNHRLPDHPGLRVKAASDRMSTHNVVHITPFPLKGEYLTAQTVFFATKVFPHIPTHLVASGSEIWQYVSKRDVPEEYQNRVLIVEELELDPVEYVFRRYLAGSLYKHLQTADDPYGLHLSRMLPLMHRFDAPIFTPTEKSATDDPLPAVRVEMNYGPTVDLMMSAFMAAEAFLVRRGITLIDAKMEGNRSKIADEFFNGDCSRMARTSEVKRFEEPPFLDKERVRQMASAKWNGEKPRPLTFSDVEVADGMRGYQEAFRCITGMSLVDFQKNGLAYSRPF